MKTHHFPLGSPLESACSLLDKVYLFPSKIAVYCWFVVALTGEFVLYWNVSLKPEPSIKIKLTAPIFFPTLFFYCGRYTHVVRNISSAEHK